MIGKVSHLHFHTEFSLSDSTVRIERLPELFERVPTHSVALTDHGTVDGAVKFYSTVSKTSVVPLLGCEFYVVDDLNDRSSKLRYHLVAIAKNRNGFSSIMRALTVANLKGFYYRPRIDWNYVLHSLEDVVLTTACTAGVFGHPKWVDIFSEMMEKFGSDLYLEAMVLRDYPAQIAWNADILKVAETTGLKIVVTNDVHYDQPDGWKVREAVSACSRNARLAVGYDVSPGSTKNAYYKPYDVMIKDAAAFGLGVQEQDIVAVWDEITDKCAFKFEKMSVSVPIAYPEAASDPAGYMRKMCWDAFANGGMKAKYPDAEQRIQHELDEICNLGFAEYFLLVKDMVDAARAAGIMVGPGRGSAGGSLAAYLMGITEVNPLDYDLVFERFISPERHDLPDIDLDFEDVRRDEVLAYMRKKYGENSVAQVSTFAMSKGRGAVRDIGRVFNVPLVEIDQVAKQIAVRSGGDSRADFTLEDTVAVFEKAKSFYVKYPHVVNIAKQIEGMTKTRGIHAAGLVVDTTDLHTGEKCVLVRGKNDEIVVNWDKEDLEYMGMMKLDVLGLKTLNVIRQSVEMIKERTGNDIDVRSLSFDDPKVIDVFAKGDTVGVFQFSSAGMIQYLRNYDAKNFNEIYHANALFRPGTLRSGLASEFILFKKGKKKPYYANDAIRRILGPTYGIVLYQEQIMHLISKMAGIPWRTADVIRKVVSKSQGQEKFEQFRQQWMDGIRRLGSMPEEEADKVFTLMKYFGAYGFNLSHSVEYSIISYRSAYLKHYYPVEFYCATLRRENDAVDISGVLSDAAKHGMDVASPNVNKSQSSWIIEGEKTLRAGMSTIKGISETVADSIVASRDVCGGVFGTWDQFISSIIKRTVNIAKVKALLTARAFAGILTELQHKKAALFIEREKRAPRSMVELETISDNEGDAVQLNMSEAIGFEIASEFYNMNKSLVDMLTQKFDVHKLDTVKEADEINTTLPLRWYIGKFDELKLGFRAQIDKSSRESKGFADDTGGVYGVFRDDSYLVYAAFTSRLYNSSMKARIEDISGKYILMQANKFRASNMYVQDVIFLDDIRGGALPQGQHFSSIVNGTLDSAVCKAIGDDIGTCAACDLRKTCRTTTPFSPGMLNVMLVGEAPGETEEMKGMPFIGKAGQILWDVMQQVGCERSMFHVTNVLKCRPVDNKITDAMVPAVLACGERYLRQELVAVKPRLIFSAGKTAMRFITGNKNASVMEKNATAEWNEKLGAWVVYSVHPAMVLYSPSARELLVASVEKFADILSKLM